MTVDPIWISESEVVDLMDLSEAIAALEEGLREEKAGHARTMAKTHVAWNDGDTLHAIGAVFDRKSWFGTKTWGHTHGGATPLFLLWEAATGRLAAVIEAFALGQMRTGGVSGVATRWMSKADASEFAVIGSGKQALAQVAAVALVRPIRTVRVFSPNPANCKAFAQKLSDQGFDFAVVVAPSVEAAVEGADIVTTVTRAREPFIHPASLAHQVHINAVGAITPERQEISQDVMKRCSNAVVDDPGSARRLASEFIQAYGSEEQGWRDVRRLSDMVDSPLASGSAGLSIFKAMGMGLSDLSLAIELHERASAAGSGRPVPHPVRASPRLRPATSDPRS
jgi:alanine dehydrogenase